MPRKSKAAQDPPQTGETRGLERMTAFNGEAVEIFARACQAYASGVASVNGELMGFINARLRHDVELGQAMCRCRDWSDAVSLQQDWAQKATQEYLAEAGRLTELASKVARESWEPLYETANEMMSDLHQ